MYSCTRTCRSGKPPFSASGLGAGTRAAGGPRTRGFFPDFLWWPNGPDGDAWAIDTTGQHLLQEKIRGKLVALGEPRMVLVVRGHADLNRERVTGADGWSAVIARTSGKALVEHAEELQRLLEFLWLH